MTNPATTEIYFATALDPIHVGTGGYRLGRVDLSIVREPGTEIPKIPGTSINGVTRAYAAMATGRYIREETITKDGSQVKVKGSCAGQGQSEGKHCGKPDCPVCVAFGFARDNGTQGSGFQGLAQFADARILFFPVHSMIGPVWITSSDTLRDHEINVTLADENKIRLAPGLKAPSDSKGKKRLNLGWLMLESEDGFTELSSKLPDVPDRIKGRSVLVSEKLFSQLVRDNLEVRTSVSIDPATGAAEDGALFTYEAIPRSTVLWFPITYSEPSLFSINVGDKQVTPAPKINGAKIEIKAVVERGLNWLEHLGIGGMNTRGLGRLKVLNLDPTSLVDPQPKPEAKQNLQTETINNNQAGGEAL